MLKQIWTLCRQELMLWMQKIDQWAVLFVVLMVFISILGSYNFTASAEDSNDENLLIIHDPEVAALLVAEFGRVYEQARTTD